MKKRHEKNMMNSFRFHAVEYTKVLINNGEVLHSIGLAELCVIQSSAKATSHFGAMTRKPHYIR